VHDAAATACHSLKGRPIEFHRGVASGIIMINERFSFDVKISRFCYINRHALASFAITDRLMRLGSEFGREQMSRCSD